MNLMQSRSRDTRAAEPGRPEIVVNHATVREQMGFCDFVRACARRGIFRVSIWEEEILKAGEGAALHALRDEGCTVFGFNRAGPLLAAEASERRRLMDVAKRSVDRAAAIGADHVLVFPGGMLPGARGLADARNQAEDCVGYLLAYARQSGVRLALEPLHPMVAGDRSCIVTMSHANDICERLGADLGVVVDVYHVWWDDRLEAEIARAGLANRIVAFHVNDWLLPTRHFLRDRGMMGDGIIDLAGIWDTIRNVGYRGPVEVEIFSDEWWSRDAGSVLDAAIARCTEIFGAALAVR